MSKTPEKRPVFWCLLGYSILHLLTARKPVAEINTRLCPAIILFLRRHYCASDGIQTITPQRDALLSTGIDPERIYEDIASGRNDARPGLKACLKALQPGNTLVLWKLDRLERDLRHLVNTVEDLRGVSI